MAAASTSTDLFKSVWIYDFEVTKDDWLMCAKHLDADEWFIAHNDNDKVIEFIRQYRPWLAGFNVKHYDQYILKGVLAGLTPEDIKGINDYIIQEGKDGWTCPLLRDTRIFIEQMDLMDDCQMGLSLKAIEAHLGMNIVESTVAFDIDRKLTDEEVDEMIYYCKYDVQATEKLFHLRENYLMTKIKLGNMVGMKPSQSARITNAMMTAKFLRAEPHEYGDEREYQYPSNLRREYIPQEVFDFFDRMHDPSVSDEDLFHSKLDITIGETPVTIGFGGIHGAIRNHYFEEVVE